MQAAAESFRSLRERSEPGREEAVAPKARMRESGRPPRAKSEGSEPSEERGEHSMRRQRRQSCVRSAGEEDSMRRFLLGAMALVVAEAGAWAQEVGPKRGTLGGGGGGLGGAV